MAPASDRFDRFQGARLISFSLSG